MKYLPIAVVLILCVALGYGLHYSSQKPENTELFARKDKVFPPIIGENLQGDTIEIRHQNQQPFLVNIWGTWCASCYIEHPFLVQLQENGINIIGINYMDNRDKAIAWLQQYKNPYSEILFDNKGHFAISLGVVGAPETYLVDENYKIVYKRTGVLNSNSWQAMCPYFQKTMAVVPFCNQQSTTATESL